MGFTDEMRKGFKSSGSSSHKPAFCTVDDFTVISSMSRRWVYDKIATGELRAVKAGVRTLVDVQFGIDYLRALPPAKFTPQRRTKIAA
jgi:hypothetical protein